MPKKKLMVAAATAACALTAVLGQQTHANAAGTQPANDDPSANTSVTFTVTVGALAISAPTAANLGSGAPGTTIGPTGIGIVTVTDNRAALNATWTATASSTDWTTGGGTGPETIPAADGTYTTGTVTSTGNVTAAAQPAFTLSGAPQSVVSATGINGNNTASWNPTISVAVPATAVGGIYTATLTHSVS